MDCAVLIPCFEPGDDLHAIVKELLGIGIENVVVVDDGSADAFSDIFTMCSKEVGCTVLRHETNEGKGSALKTAMSYCVEHFPRLTGVVTMDCDGQHSPHDVLTVAKLLEERKDALILGSRDFDAPCVPRYCRIGNKLTRKLVDNLYRAPLSDAQTGLRGIPAGAFKKLIKQPGKRFDFEMNVLLSFINDDAEIIETPIETIYKDNNSGSHFRKFKDSAKIYWPMFSRFIKFSASAFGWYMLEFIIYTLLIKLAFKDLDYGSLILASQAVSKIISSTGNFLVNKHSVFKKDGDNIECLVKYGLVLLLLVVASSTLISMSMEVFGIGISRTAAVKLVVDFFMMLINFMLQRRWVFSDKHLIS